METILNPVWCILKSVKIRAIRGQNSNEASEFGLIRQERQAYMENFTAKSAK